MTIDSAGEILASAWNVWAVLVFAGADPSGGSIVSSQSCSGSSNTSKLTRAQSASYASPLACAATSPHATRRNSPALPKRDDIDVELVVQPSGTVIESSGNGSPSR